MALNATNQSLRFAVTDTSQYCSYELEMLYLENMQANTRSLLILSFYPKYPVQHMRYVQLKHMWRAVAL
jgi:hypothetical protein